MARVASHSLTGPLAGRLRRTAVVALAAVLTFAVAAVVGGPRATAKAPPSSDFFAHRQGRVWYLRPSLTSGGAGIAFSFGLAGDLPVMGDWNGDGTATPGVFRDGV